MNLNVDDKVLNDLEWSLKQECPLCVDLMALRWVNYHGWFSSNEIWERSLVTTGIMRAPNADLVFLWFTKGLVAANFIMSTLLDSIILLLSFNVMKNVN